MRASRFIRSRNTGSLLNSAVISLTATVHSLTVCSAS
ncbi:Uncharacterised protein [Mycobacterium tuberculosis]|uniref:Uncharacterized protein n=1 Tax=Mycobacterium tuberculosis TaxID=1773 RepID=A0A916P7C6_MYCTX|nr:Uncharacterised protein [Mycobacterium tuberculosis]CPA40007.1 Uncharacterised protein [Mycobacterium tuberculosis]